MPPQTFDVVNLRRYSFKDSESGKLIQGSKITAIGDIDSSSPDIRGRSVLIFSGELQLFDKMTQVPGKYDLELTPKMSGGKVVVSVSSATLNASPRSGA